MAGMTVGGDVVERQKDGSALAPRRSTVHVLRAGLRMLVVAVLAVVSGSNFCSR